MRNLRKFKNTMALIINTEWDSLLKDEMNRSYFAELEKFVLQEYKNTTCYPPMEQIFSAFDLCLPKDVKIVIIGQDPYHGEQQANGLCFSVNEKIAIPPSLRNIFKEIEQDIPSTTPPLNGNLERWAQQGVLLLNATLTVKANKAGSHQKQGWETFTDAVIKTISTHQDSVIFMLWGGYAKKKTNLIDRKKHTILSSGHPSPLSANRGYWFGNKHFSKANKLLKKYKKEPILW